MFLFYTQICTVSVHAVKTVKLGDNCNTTKL